MVNRMIVANVLHRPVRTIVSVLAVAIEVSMVMLVVGMTHGLLHEADGSLVIAAPQAGAR